MDIGIGAKILFSISGICFIVFVILYLKDEVGTRKSGIGVVIFILIMFSFLLAGSGLPFVGVEPFGWIFGLLIVIGLISGMGGE